MPPNLVVILRRFLELRAGYGIVLDPELPLGLLDESLNHLAALGGLLLIEIGVGNNLECKFFGIVVEISGKKDGACLVEFQKQRLVTQGMTWRELDHDFAVAENVMVFTVEQ